MSCCRKAKSSLRANPDPMHSSRLISGIDVVHATTVPQICSPHQPLYLMMFRTAAMAPGALLVLWSQHISWSSARRLLEKLGRRPCRLGQPERHEQPHPLCRGHHRHPLGDTDASRRQPEPAACAGTAEDPAGLDWRAFLRTLRDPHTRLLRHLRTLLSHQPWANLILRSDHRSPGLCPVAIRHRCRTELPPDRDPLTQIRDLRIEPTSRLTASCGYVPRTTCDFTLLTRDPSC